MHDLPRQKLTELLAQHGHGLCDNEKRLEAMLKDLLRNEHKRETFVLMSTLREGVAQELRSPTSGMPLAAVTAKLVRQLRDNLALDETAACWGVESWAFALGVKITQPAVRVKKPVTPPVAVPTSPPTASRGEKLVLAASSDGDPSVSPEGGIDLAAIVLYHRTKAEQEKAKAEQEKQYAAEVHRQARELADDANDYETAIQLIESLDAKWRDEQLYLSVCERRDHERDSKAQVHAEQVQHQAKQYAKQTRDFAGAARMIEEIAPLWRDWKLHEKMCGYRDQVARLDADIRDAVENGRLHFLRGRVLELLKLQPQRNDMRRLLDVLPNEADLPTEFTNSIGMRFVLIPPGEFTMGSNERDDEQPPHSVRITRPFYLGVFPVTQAEYQAVTGHNPSQATGNLRQPVEQVSWSDAVAYCEKLGKSAAEAKQQRTYRIPTEAEWEYACRAGSTGKWCFGDDALVWSNYMWVKDNSTLTTHAVGTKMPNAWGLYDMHGNVWEWCQDVYDKNAYASRRGKTTNDPLVTSGSNDRVFRGGSWCHTSRSSTSASRGRDAPILIDCDYGFRVACSIPS